MTQTFKVGHLPSITWNRLHLNEASVETALSGNLPGSRYLSLPQGASVRTLSFAQALAELEKTAPVQEQEKYVAGKAPVYHPQKFGTGLGADYEQAMQDAGVPVEWIEIGPAEQEQTITCRMTLQDGESASCAQILHVGENAQVTALYVSESAEDAAGVLALSVRVVLEKGASLKLALVQLLGSGFTALSDVGLSAADGAGAELIQMELGADRSYVGVQPELIGKEASFDSAMGYLANGEQRLDINYNAVQRGRQTRCAMTFDGVLGDRAQKVFRGTIDFRNGSSGSKGEEQENVLLLSNDVENRTMPVILCEEEDVEGSHGATIGRLDEQVLFYLATRGIDAAEAQKMMVRARLGAVARRIPDEAARRRAQDYIDRKVNCDTCVRAADCPQAWNEKGSTGEKS